MFSESGFCCVLATDTFSVQHLLCGKHINKRRVPFFFLYSKNRCRYRGCELQSVFPNETHNTGSFQARNMRGEKRCVNEAFMGKLLDCHTNGSLCCLPYFYRMAAAAAEIYVYVQEILYNRHSFYVEGRLQTCMCLCASYTGM